MFKFDLDGNMVSHYDLRKFPQIHASIQAPILSQQEINHGAIDFRDPRTHELSTFDTLHVNSIGQLPNGDYLISLGLVVGKKFSFLMRIKDYLNQRGLWSWFIRINQFIQKIFSLQKDRHSNLIVQPAKGTSIIVRLSPREELNSCLAIDEVNVPSHSVAARSDGTALYLNTTLGNIVHFDPSLNRILSTKNISDQFLRGLCKVTEDAWIAGSQNNLLWFDLNSQKIIRQFQLSENQKEAVFAIHEFPENFSLPPKSFDKKLGKLIGFQGFSPIFE